MLGFEWVTAGNPIWMTVLYFQNIPCRAEYDNSKSRRVPEDGADFFNPLLL